jgi:hypothetical protein
MPLWIISRAGPSRHVRNPILVPSALVTEPRDPRGAHAQREGPHDEMDRRGITCFDRPLADIGLADDEQLVAAGCDRTRGRTGTTVVQGPRTCSGTVRPVTTWASPAHS